MRNLKQKYYFIIAVFSIFLLNTASVSFGSSIEKTSENCQSLLVRTEGASDSVPVAIAELIKGKVLFNYLKTFSYTSDWCKLNRANLGSTSPKRQKEVALDAVLIKDNGELVEDFQVWENLAEHLWSKQRADFISEILVRIIRPIEKNKPTRTEFIALYAALLREYFTAIKGSSKSIANQYMKVLDNNSPAGSSHLKQDLKKGAALGVVTGAGILAMHFAFGAVALVPDLILLATAGPSATLLPSAYRFAKGMILSIQPVKYLSIYQGEELVKALDEIFGAKLRRGYKSHMYWSAHEGVSQSMRFVYNIDLTNYNPDFKTIEEAEDHMNALVNEFLLFSENLNEQKIKLVSGIDTVLLQARSFQEQEALLNKANSVEIKLKMLKIINTLYQMIKVVIEQETQLNRGRSEKTALLQAGLTTYNKRLEEIMLLLTTVGNVSSNGARANKLIETSANWTSYTALLLNQTIHSQVVTTQLKETNDALAILAALSTYDPSSNSNAKDAIKKTIEVLEKWRESILVNQQKAD